MMKDRNIGNVYNQKKSMAVSKVTEKRAGGKEPLCEAFGQEDARRAKTITDRNVRARVQK